MNRRALPRLLEILPPATVWLIITAPIWAAVIAPAALGFGLILFSVYWLWKSTMFAGGVLIGFAGVAIPSPRKTNRPSADSTKR